MAVGAPGNRKHGRFNADATERMAGEAGAFGGQTESTTWPHLRATYILGKPMHAIFSVTWVGRCRTAGFHGRRGMT